MATWGRDTGSGGGSPGEGLCLAAGASPTVQAGEWGGPGGTGATPALGVRCLQGGARPRLGHAEAGPGCRWA